MRIPMHVGNKISSKEWRPWFAWYPVYVEEPGCFVWLERLERKPWFTMDDMGYYHRFPQEEKNENEV